ncbi:MAG: YifB family Mg chelatase-like AAA ATPase [Smithellaceae bacterium]|nr:YifB family Mg chelatase-like AAA ATPase [Smithellaceae bacterium]
MIVKVTSGTILGIVSHPVQVEVDISSGLPMFTTVGLPDAAVKESRDRIKAAIKNSGYPFPRTHLTVNLAPADIRKEGTGFDLPIAVAILAAQGMIRSELLNNYLYSGELSLDGAVKTIPGILSNALLTRELGMKGIVTPKDNVLEATLVSGLDVIPVNSLAEVVEHLNGTRIIPPAVYDSREFHSPAVDYNVDFSEVQGQDQAKRALEIAAAGGHNLIMIGPPGSGKTMLAHRLCTILPDLSLEEAIETSRIFSVAGLLDRSKPLLMERPFRAPHHTISDAGLVGGGQQPRPGEISLAHQGVLFLDELPEFGKHVLETLRQPLENGQVTITRSAGIATYPARFMLVAAMNPCPCGYYGDPQHTCRCSAQQIRQYQGRISGPLYDRIDIHLEVSSVRFRDLKGSYAGEPSDSIRARVCRARERQKGRFPGELAPFNAKMTERQVKDFCKLDSDSQQLIEMAMDKLGLSARAYNRILKLSRTIADLAGEEKISAQHVAEAIQYRNLDRRII